MLLNSFVLVVHLFVCVALIAIILLQAGRGGGVADTFGGSAAQSILGSRGTQFLTRATTVCATVFMLTSLTLAYLSAQRGRSLMERMPVKPAATVTTPAPEKPAPPP